MEDKLVQLLKNLETRHTAKVYRTDDGKFSIYLVSPLLSKLVQADTRAEASNICWDWCFPKEEGTKIVVW